MLSFSSGISRVTRLGEFSPIGRLFILCSFFVNHTSTYVAKAFGKKNFHGTNSCIRFGKECGVRWWALFWVIFFRASSGHPAR
jgi:Na+-driven multidrug efflux pump